VPLSGEPLLLAASWDGHQVAVGYEEEQGRIEVFHVGDLRQQDGRPRASHALPHGLRVLRWTKAGRHRLLAGGDRHLSYLWDDGRLTTRALDRALGSADWSPEQDDVVAVSYFGEGAWTSVHASESDHLLLRTFRKDEEGEKESAPTALS
jgi:hypothetical protein